MNGQENNNNPAYRPATNNLRLSPASDLDLQLLVTNPVWGKGLEIQGEIKDTLTKTSKRFLKKGDVILREGKAFVVQEDYSEDVDRNLWDELQAIYTRDLRLGFLSTWNGEAEQVKYYINLSGDLLQEGFKEPFFKCLKESITILEVSQSKGGFLRNRQATFTHESINKGDEVPKRNLLGMRKQGNQGGGGY